MLNLSINTQHGMSEMGYCSLTQAQERAIREMRNYGDIILQSRPGSGKSTFVAINESECKDLTGVSLVFVPTAELVQQTSIFLKRFLAASSIVCLSIVDLVESKQSLNGKRAIVVGTPHQVRMSLAVFGPAQSMLRLYFDEADDLFSNGKLDSTVACINHLLHGYTQTFFMSSTIPPYIASRIREVLGSVTRQGRACRSKDDQPFHIELCSSCTADASKNAVRENTIKHKYVLRRDSDEVGPIVDRIIKRYSSRKLHNRWESRDDHISSNNNVTCIVFGTTVKEARAGAAYLSKTRGYTSVLLDKSMLPSLARSSNVLFDPKGNFSRGINIPHVRLGICFAIPEDKETVLHQWGRVARELGSIGEVYMVVRSSELSTLQYISFQLGVQFEEEFVFDRGTDVSELPGDMLRMLHQRAPSHPFHLASSVEERLLGVNSLVVRV